MCKYCRQIKTGDCNESIIKSEWISNGAVLTETDVWINDDKLMLLVTNLSGVTIQKKSKKIKYCPMCGKKIES